jgi:hypothetical protein
MHWRRNLHCARKKKNIKRKERKKDKKRGSWKGGGIEERGYLEGHAGVRCQKQGKIKGKKR